MDAPVIKCAVCGGPARAGDRTCQYCGAGIATVRCTHCFHENTVDAIHCAGCGGELGPLLESTTGTVSCPDCKTEVMGYDSPAGTLFSCERCGGQFVQHALFRSLLEHPVIIGHAAPALSLEPRNPLSERVRYRPCPVCENVMNRKNFGGTSGVIVDVCMRHGTWFDPGELPRVLEYVKQGGLEHERLKERERARVAESQTRVAGRLAAGTLQGPREQSDGVDLVSDLLEFVEGLLKR